jgi:hypothetical protein
MPAPQFFSVCCEQVMVMQLFDDGNVMHLFASNIFSGLDLRRVG